jgi:RimJ/RimL family protein N-acetyltransferase
VPVVTAQRVELRAVEPADLEVFFIQQQDPAACEMAAFPPRPRPDFDAHWARVLADPSAITRTVLVGGVVAGNAACFGPSDQREVAYWIGREFWGLGVATAALRCLLAELSERPLHAIVAQHNAASLRVLEKCGFERRGEQLAEDGILEIELELGR